MAIRIEPLPSPRQRCLSRLAFFLGASALLSPGCADTRQASRTEDPMPKPAPALVEAPKPLPEPVAVPAALPAPSAPQPAGISLFDGKTLTGWALADIAGRGEVTVKDGSLILGMGYMTGVVWTNANLPQTNYEITLDAMRVDGSDFFCGLTFPVGDSHCSFIAGGWGGGVVGLSSIDDLDAANNDTTSYRQFEEGRWYAMKVRVTPEKIQAWIDGEPVVDQVITDRRVGIRIEMDTCLPLGLASYSTTAALRNIRLRPLEK